MVGEGGDLNSSSTTVTTPQLSSRRGAVLLLHACTHRGCWSLGTDLIPSDQSSLLKNNFSPITRFQILFLLHEILHHLLSQELLTKTHESYKIEPLLLTYCYWPFKAQMLALTFALAVESFGGVEG
eukprot:scaffold161379_cov129-Cyclotella_meneghiniana.AAC.1